MEFKRLDKRKGSGATSIRSRYAYLIHLSDIDYFPPTNDKGVRLEGDIVLQEGRTMIPVYLTNPSQEYSYETQGADDEKTFRVKFTGTHPGTELEALEFSKNLIEESFLVLIPGCEKNTPGKLLGQIENPMIFTSTHKAAKDGDKFTFNFEQRIGSEFIYFSYGGIVSLPPEGGDPDIPVPSPGFDPSKWAKRDASNIDGNNVLLWREALEMYSKSEVDDIIDILVDEIEDVNLARIQGDNNLQGQITFQASELDTEEVNRAMADAAIQSQVTSNTMTRSSVTDKMVHYWDQSVMRWISTGVEFLGNAVLKLKIIAFGGYTVAQKNAIVSPVEGMLIYQNETPKGFQKYENGAWSELGGSNISTADLSNVSARTFTQGNTFTWNTAGHFHYLKGLLDKTGNGAYTKALIIHPTTGERVTRDFADPAATTLAVQNASAAQKTSMRTALLGTATPASPIINVVNTYYIKRNTFTMLILSGVNLTPLDPTFIWIQNGAQRVDASSYFALSATGLQTFWTIPSDFPLGEYLVNLSFGAVTQGANIGKLVIVDESSVLKHDITSLNTIIKFRTGYTPVANRFYFAGDNSFTHNMFAVNGVSGYDGSDDSIMKTDNVFLGGVNSSWEIIIEITKINFPGNGGSGPYPLLTMTETSNELFDSSNQVFRNYNILFATQGHTTSIRNSSGNSGANLSQTVPSPTATIVIRKSGNVLTTYILDINTGSVAAFASTSIDTSKNYALALLNPRVSDAQRAFGFKFSTSIYNQ